MFKNDTSLYLTRGELSTSSTYLPLRGLLTRTQDPEDLGHFIKVRELDLGKVTGPWSFYHTGAAGRQQGRGFDLSP